MNTILKFQLAYGHVQGTVPKPLDQAQLKNWEQQDLLAQILIKNNTSDEQMVHINQDSITMAAQMWQSLRAVHERRGQSGVTGAKHTFYGMWAPDDVNIPEHVAEMRRQQNKLHQMGCKIDNEEFKAVLVMSLPQSWDHLISSYQGMHLKPNNEDDHGITSQELTSVLIDEYQHHLDSGIVPENQSRTFYAQLSTGNKKRKVEIINKNTASTSTLHSPP